jgi:hypothetical protein
VKALKPANLTVVGVANNVASGPREHPQEPGRARRKRHRSRGAGRTIDAAHVPAIVERKGVKIGFLQYTARW